MFTGLVEVRGSVMGLVDRRPARRLKIDVGADWAADSAIGDSVAINGCCLSVVGIGERSLEFEAGPETLACTNLGELATGDPVNLERPLAVGGRLGGHFVQGHIDDTASVVEVTRDGEWVTMWFELPVSLAGQLVPKGSVAVDGVSLTVVDVVANRFSVALIPHTLDVTTLGIRGEGTRVNIETDILAKYVKKLVDDVPLDLSGTPGPPKQASGERDSE
jgi:riboflavin synthase